jgi:hypothetical protein
MIQPKRKVKVDSRDEGQEGRQIVLCLSFSRKNEKGSELNNDVSYHSHVRWGFGQTGLRLDSVCVLCTLLYPLFLPSIPCLRFRREVNAFVKVRAYLYTSPPHLIPSSLTYHSQ